MQNSLEQIKAFEAWVAEQMAVAQGSLLGELAVLVALLTFLFLVRVAARRWVLRWMEVAAQKSPFEWDNVLIEHKVVRGTLSLVLLAMLFWLLEFLPSLTFWGQRVVGAYFPIALARVLDRALSAAGKLYLSHPMAARRPIKGFLQLAKILAYLIGVVLSISVIVGVSPVVLVSGLGAMTAVLILVFKDLILSVLASIHIAANDLIQQDDWLEVPQYEADGMVIEMALYTIKIQNWDKTISVIPTYKILETPFKNWRGMTESGGRRIKRWIYLDQHSVHFVGVDYLERLLSERRISFALASVIDDLSERARSGALTNLSVLRRYLEGYLDGHPQVSEGLPFMVRQLQPTPQGLPLEIYAFASDVRWEFYERIQSEMLEEILAMLPKFELSVFQAPSGLDLRGAVPAAGAL